MKITHSKRDIPLNAEFIRIDVGNEFVYLYDIDSKSYLDISHVKNEQLKNHLVLRQ